MRSVARDVRRSAPRLTISLRTLAQAAIVACAAFFAAGCDTGGLLVVEHKKPDQGPPVNEFASSGTYAKNEKYRLFFTFGQATPNQGTGKSETHKLNGGIVGAAHSDY